MEKLTDIQRASILELIAGKRQGNIVSSLLENFDVARDALETAMDSEGSAMEEHEKWLESLEAKTKQFQAAWEGLSQAFMDDDFLKQAVDLGTKFLSTITDIIDAIGTVPTLFIAAMTALSFKKVGRIEMLILL